MPPTAATATRNWLKLKCIQRQEFVVVGWSESDKRRGFKSLLLAANEDGKLTYVGKVGTGFNTKMIEDLSERMRPLEIDKPALDVPRAERRGGALAEARAGRRDRLHRIHLRRHPSPPELHRAARGQAGEPGGDRERQAAAQGGERPRASDARKPRHQDHQPRPGDLPDREADQGRPRRLIMRRSTRC